LNSSPITSNPGTVPNFPAAKPKTALDLIDISMDEEEEELARSKSAKCQMRNSS
jgi:hypothetical protein